MALAADEQVANDEKRAWARANGWPDLGDRGKFPDAVNAAWEAFTAAQSGADDGADFGAAAAAMGLQIEAGASPLDDDSAQDPDGGGSDGPPPSGADLPGPGAEQPEAGRGANPQPRAGEAQPVVSLEDARARVAAGGKASPGWAGPPGGKGRASGEAGSGSGRRARRPKPPPPPDPGRVEVTPQLLDDMSGKLAMLLAPPGKWAQRVDPYCGGKFAEQAPDIIDALTPIMARSQFAIKMLTADALFFQLYALVVAVMPVADAVYDHHFSEDAKKAKDQAQRTAAASQTAEDELNMYPSQPFTAAGHVPDYRAPRAQV